eukprot:m.51768 g.51768  ORF g.51768 m.51768 type:complete len:1290 (-) comp7579_c0_seq1:125-3994(-)
MSIAATTLLHQLGFHPIKLGDLLVEWGILIKKDGEGGVYGGYKAVEAAFPSHQNDSTPFQEGLLENPLLGSVIIVMCKDAPSFDTNTIMFGAMGTLKNILDRVISVLFEEGNCRVPKHLLCQGHKRSESKGTSIKSLPGLQVVFPNPFKMALMASSHWRQLHKFLGDCATYHLLKYSNIFEPLAHAQECLVQICGYPITHEVSNQYRICLPPFLTNSEGKRKNSCDIETEVNVRKRSKQKHFITIQRCYEQNLAERYCPNHILSKLHTTTTIMTKKMIHTLLVAIFIQSNIHKPQPLNACSAGKVPKRIQRHASLFREICERCDSIQIKKLYKKICRWRRKPSSTMQNEVLGWDGKRNPSLLLKDERKSEIFEKEKCGDMSSGDDAIDKFESDDEMDGFITQEEDEFDDNNHNEEFQMFSTTSATAAVAVRRLKMKNEERKQAHSNLSLEKLLASSCSHLLVARFVIESTKHIFPQKVFGCPQNWSLLSKKVLYVVSATRFAKFDTEFLCSGFKTSSIAWLSSTKIIIDAKEAKKRKKKKEAKQCNGGKTGQEFERTYLQIFISWYFSSFVSTLLRSFFYATETTLFRNKVVYYPKFIWRKISRLAKQSQHVRDVYTTIGEDEKEILQPLGCPSLRFKPKSSSLRLIVNMAAKDSRNNNKISINQRLQTPLSILTFEQKRQEGSTGSAVFGVYYFQEKYRSFVHHSTSGLPSLTNGGGAYTKKLHFVSVDVKNCFDTISQEKLVDIVNEVLREDEYLTRRFATLFNNKGKVEKKFVRRSLDSSSSSSNFKRFASKQNLRNAVIVDQGQNYFESKENVVKLIKKHLTANVIQMGNKCFKQKTGIAQGSSLSTMLCNLFYGHMEKHHLSFILKDKGSLMVRMVDDFLLVTPHLHIASKFLLKMQQGFSEYNCKINAAKTKTNIEMMNPCFSHVSNSSSTSQTSAPSSHPHVAASEPGFTQKSSKTNSNLTQSYFEFNGFGDPLTLTQMSIPNQVGGLHSHTSVVYNDADDDDNNKEVDISNNDDETVSPHSQHTISLFSSGMTFLSGSTSSETCASQLSFVTQSLSPQSGRCVFQKVAENANEGEWFPWIGLLFNMSSMHVRVDFSRYNGVHLRDCITIDRQIVQAEDLVRKGEGFIDTKSFSILFDCSVNSPMIIGLNLFQMVYIGIAKLHCLVRELPIFQRPQNNPQFFFRLFDHLALFSVNIVLSRCRSSGVRCGLSNPMILMISKKAIHVALSRKRSFYFETVNLLTINASDSSSSQKKGNENRLGEKYLERIAKHSFNTDLYATMW